MIEQQKGHQSSKQHFIKTNQLLAEVDLLNIASQHDCIDNVMQWVIHWNNNNNSLTKMMLINFNHITLY